MINIKRSGSGKSLVLFHGWGFDHHIWDPILPALNANYEVFAVDLPGFGKTAWMPWEVFVPKLLVQLRPTFALAGWSLGGLFATRLAIEHPLKVTQLMNIASSPRFLADELWQGLAPEIFARFYQQILQDPTKALTDFQALQKFSPLPSPGLPPSQQGLKQGLDILKTWDLRSQLVQLKLPVSYLFGRLDAITPYKTLAAMQAIYPHFEYHSFKKSAHMPFLSETDMFLDILEDFLA